jgi:hypothetical protein
MAKLVSVAKVQTESREVNQLQNNILQVLPPLNRLITAAERANSMAALGIWVGTAAPTTAITYAQWLSGLPGYWSWITIP